jgi:hypothetical protein
MYSYQRLLNDVFGLGDTPKHPVTDRERPGPELLEQMVLRRAYIVLPVVSGPRCAATWANPSRQL